MQIQVPSQFANIFLAHQNVCHEFTSLKNGIALHVELTRTDRKAASDWLLLNDQILTIIFDTVTFSEGKNKIE